MVSENRVSPKLCFKNRLKPLTKLRSLMLTIGCLSFVLRAALERGGVQSSATIADVFDIGGFALLALFNGYVGKSFHSNEASLNCVKVTIVGRNIKS